MICSFCEMVATGADVEFKFRYPEAVSRVLYQDEKLIVTPTIGQLLPSHLLVVAKEHVTKFFPEGWTIVDDAFSAIKELGYRGGLIFEHGISSETEARNCGIAHAHLHYLSLQPHSIVAVVAAFKAKTRAELVPLKELIEISRQADEYLYLTDDGETFCVAQENLESQLLRKIIAAQFGLQWDWRKYERQEWVEALLEPHYVDRMLETKVRL